MSRGGRRQMAQAGTPQRDALPCVREESLGKEYAFTPCARLTRESRDSSEASYTIRLLSELLDEDERDFEYNPPDIDYLRDQVGCDGKQRRAVRGDADRLTDEAELPSRRQDGMFPMADDPQSRSPSKQLLDGVPFVPLPTSPTKPRRMWQAGGGGRCSQRRMEAMANAKALEAQSAALVRDEVKLDAGDGGARAADERSCGSHRHSEELPHGPRCAGGSSRPDSHDDDHTCPALVGMPHLRADGDDALDKPRLQAHPSSNPQSTGPESCDEQAGRDARRQGKGPLGEMPKQGSQRNRYGHGQQAANTRCSPVMDLELLLYEPPQPIRGMGEDSPAEDERRSARQRRGNDGSCDEPSNKTKQLEAAFLMPTVYRHGPSTQPPQQRQTFPNLEVMPSAPRIPLPPRAFNGQNDGTGNRNHNQTRQPNHSSSHDAHDYHRDTRSDSCDETVDTACDHLQPELPSTPTKRTETAAAVPYDKLPNHLPSYDAALQFVARSAEPLVMTDAAGRICSVNAAWVELCGYQLDDVKGKTCALLQGDDTDAGTVAVLNEKIRRGEQCTMTLVNYKNAAVIASPRFVNRLTVRPFYCPARTRPGSGPSAGRRPSAASAVLGALQRRLSFGLGSASGGGIDAAVSPLAASHEAPEVAPVVCHYIARLCEIGG